MKSASASTRDYFRALSPPQKIAFLQSLSDEDFQAVYYDWYGWWARAKQQIPEGSWTYWMILAGRGFGKTRSGAQWVRDGVEHRGLRNVGLVSRTVAEIRAVLVEGESGILAVSRPDFLPRWEPAQRKLTWPNGAVARCYSADAPEQVTGQNFDGAWADEAASWYQPTVLGAKSAWDNLMFACRLTTDQGASPQILITTTPRPGHLMRKLMALPRLHLTTGSSYENRENLAPSYFEAVIAPYEGTRLGMQEIYAQVFEDNPDALWTYATIEKGRMDAPKPLQQIVVAVDPEAVSNEGSAETGILVVGRDARKHGYVLEDCTLRGSPMEWARAAVSAYHRWRARALIAEINNGGEMIEALIRTVDPTVRYRAVRATKGKIIRAEPIASLYEQGRIHHAGIFPELETQLTQWTPGVDRSPDRLDALVWGCSALMLGGSPSRSPVTTAASVPRPASLSRY